MTEPSNRRFMPLIDFTCEESGEQYVKGLGYTARTPDYDRRLDKWLAEGKATLHGVQPARVHGIGIVSWPEGSKK